MTPRTQVAPCSPWHGAILHPLAFLKELTLLCPINIEEAVKLKNLKEPAEDAESNTDLIRVSFFRKKKNL